MNESPFLTLEELAGRYGHPIETIRGWRKRGALPPAYRLGGMLHWKREDIERWESQQKERAVLEAGLDVQSSHRFLRTNGRTKWS